MHHMAYPKQIYLVAIPMRPVVEKINAQKKQKDGPAIYGHIKKPEVLVNHRIQSDDKHFGKKAGYLLKNATTDICKCIPQPIQLFIGNPTIHQLYPD